MEGRYPTTKPTTILTVPDLGGGQRGRGPGPPTNTGPSIEQFFFVFSGGIQDSHRGN